MKIAVLASREGEKAIYLHDFFKEGNRIAIDCLLTDNPDSPVARRLASEGIEVIRMDEQTQMAELADLLRQRDVEVLVVDGYDGDIPPELRDIFGHAIVYPTARESGPLEVIETTDRLKAAANAAWQRQQQLPEKKEDEKEADGHPSVEQEWAQALDINVDTPADDKDPDPQQQSPEEPAQPEQPAQPGPPPYGQQGQYGPVPPQHPQQPFGHRSWPYSRYYPGQQPYDPNRPGADTPPEPMPDTYLVWSVIITILCCLIPGVIAIIYSASVSSKYYRGNFEGARRASRMAQIWCIVSIICGIVWGTLYIPLTLFLS